ncbi:50S ribosomal protein L11 [Shouchella clausii]|uniref:Large ribosomal subunit protein uL11 n=1 Tax=Shouchella clausii TaxID=79880 RepID=A0A268S4Z9_SHOCL|nr:50S ribosomal protein L11 [Shouchella clausii]PAD43670.1 50S ribosomal protein L11 [Bacillus sp. 7520-S]MBU8595291.1 50S ribosomal protein L11 [Shouchella clausii]MCY1103349.1 50S ribosomal protein L11 [Shouchella clausii]PAD10898.1 50S ribosomal protein L11 [Shouchella clausii]PAD12820.1 50S ribosomal protein L11 [Shouchella clausii]
MEKSIKRIMTIHLQAGKANGAKVGKDLAPMGINILSFCNQYNEMTKNQQGVVIPANVTIYDDRSFSVELKTPPTAFLLKQYAGVGKGAANPGKEVVGSITPDQLRAIAKIKLPDLNTTKIDSAMKIIAGTAKNMGIEIGNQHRQE